MRLIKPDCNATGAFPARFYLSFTNPRLGIKWIQIFYHCVGRCWWVVIVFLYFLDVLVWVALLLAKVHRTEVKKRNISYPRLSQRPCWSYLISARKLPQNNDITTVNTPRNINSSTGQQKLWTQQRKTKTFNVKKQYTIQRFNNRINNRVVTIERKKPPRYQQQLWFQQVYLYLNTTVSTLEWLYFIKQKQKTKVSTTTMVSSIKRVLCPFYLSTSTTNHSINKSRLYMYCKS